MDDKIGVLIVDDSAFMRKTISTIIEEDPRFVVVGKARNGLDAIEKISRVKPHVVTLDIEMPELDGIQTLKRLVSEHPIPVIMLSNDADSTLEAFDNGAVDFIVKKNLIKENNLEEIKDFHQRITIAANAKIPVPVIRGEEKQEVPQKIAVPILQTEDEKWDLLIIGSSTGGPAALQKILTRLPENFPVPILVIQHMPPGFTKPLADRFNGLCNLVVKEAEHNEVLKPGIIYIAPAGLYTTIQKNNEEQYMIRLKITSPVESLYKPSVDVALLSIASIANSRLLVVILTGMGDDGLKGCKKVNEYGGTIITESEETCVVYGMPKVVFEAGLADEQIPLDMIYDGIINRF